MGEMTEHSCLHKVHNPLLSVLRITACLELAKDLMDNSATYSQETDQSGNGWRWGGG